MADMFAPQGRSYADLSGPIFNGGTAQAPAGSDPFAYTGGSLLTPWTQAFTPPPEAGGGYSAPAYTPFQFAAFNAGPNYNPGTFSATTIAAPDKQSYDAFTPAAAYTPDQVQGPAAYQGQNVIGQTIAAPGTITAQTVAGQQVARPDQIQGPAALQASTFTAPTQAEAANDPGYQFALRQGNAALGNKFAASGLRGAGQAQAFADYNQNAAAQQYQNVYGRRFGEYNAANQAAAQAYGLTNQYQQAAAMANQGANLQAGMTNAQLAQQAALANQATGLQAQTANVGNQLQANQFNAAQQQQANLANQQQAFQAWNAQTGYGQQAALANQQAGLSAADMNARNALNAYNANFNVANTVAQNNFSNAFNVANANNQNALGAYQATTNAGLGAANLNYQMAAGTYDRNYAAARQNYSDQQQAAAAAASAGAANSNQAYNRALQQYQMQHDIFQENQQNQFSRLMAMANLGNPGMVNPMQYAGGMADIYGQGANAAAAGQIGAGNAWQQAFGGVAQGVGGAAGAYAAYHPNWIGG